MMGMGGGGARGRGPRGIGRPRGSMGCLLRGGRYRVRRDGLLLAANIDAATSAYFPASQKHLARHGLMDHGEEKIGNNNICHQNCTTSYAVSPRSPKTEK